MNQWIERIQFALPNARIGIIQGSKCEIENKDIVIGMLQSLSLKDFSKDTFSFPYLFSDTLMPFFLASFNLFSKYKILI